MKKEEKRNIIKLILLLLGLLLFTSIPLILFNIDYDSFTITQKALYLFSCNIIFLIIIIACNFKILKKDFKLFIKDLSNNLEISFKYWLLGFIGMIISNVLIIIINNGSIANNEESVRELIELAPLYMAFSTMIYAPLTEELIFRKCFKDIFKNKWVFIIMSGFTFGAMHVVSSITNITDILFIIPYSCLGIMFAYAYHKTNNIFTTISMHAFHNTLAFVLYLVMYGMII